MWCAWLVPLSCSCSLTLNRPPAVAPEQQANQGPRRGSDGVPGLGSDNFTQTPKSGSDNFLRHRRLGIHPISERPPTSQRPRGRTSLESLESLGVGCVLWGLSAVVKVFSSRISLVQVISSLLAAALPGEPTAEDRSHVRVCSVGLGLGVNNPWQLSDPEERIVRWRGP